MGGGGLILKGVPSAPANLAEVVRGGGTGYNNDQGKNLSEKRCTIYEFSQKFQKNPK